MMLRYAYMPMYTKETGDILLFDTPFDKIRGFVLFSNDDHQTASLKEKDLESLGMTREEAFDAARKTTFENARIYSMREMLGLPHQIEEGEIPIYVVTVKESIFGASAIESGPVQRRLSELLHTNELCVIPSSVHEVLVTAWEDLEGSGIDDAIRFINMEEVEVKDILSDHACKLIVK